MRYFLDASIFRDPLVVSFFEIKCRVGFVSREQRSGSFKRVDRIVYL